MPHSKTRGAVQTATREKPPGSCEQTQSTTPYREEAAAPNWETLAIACHFRLPELARTCGVSMRTLQRHFRKHYNTTVSDWVRHLKLERARVMLAEAESVKCVAFDLGYKQPSHFTRDFKEHFGVPPSAVRIPLPLRIQISPRARAS